MFNWRKKKEPKTGRRFYIPEGHMEKVAELATLDDKLNSKASRYRLWKYISDFIPEVRDGNWILRCGKAIRYYAEEIL
jgi:hypothetical protein